jgi:hypothetical protein
MKNVTFKKIVLTSVLTIITGVFLSAVFAVSGAKSAFGDTIYTVDVTQPVGGEQWTGTHDILWLTNAPPGFYAYVSCLVGPDGSATEYPLSGGLQDKTWFEWDTAMFGLDSDQCKIKVRVEHGLDDGEGISPNFFTVHNTPPDLPVIISPTTHQLETGPVTFVWTASSPIGIAGYSFKIDGLPNTIVDTIPEGTMTEKTYLHLSDTTYYFHVRAVDTAGSWSGTTHYQIVVSSIGFLLDDYDDGDGINGFGGARGSFQSSDGSYCGVSLESSPAVVYGGTGNSLALGYYIASPSPVGWAGMWTTLEDGSLLYYNSVSMWVKGSLGENFQVGLGDGTNETKVELTDYLPGGASTTWQKVTIPFAAFTDIQNWGNMYNLSITFIQELSPQGIIYIDKVMFEDVQTTPIPENTWMIDDFNDAFEDYNYRLYRQWNGDSRDYSGNGVIALSEPFLHGYDDNKTNEVKELHYEIPASTDWAWYSTDVWGGIVPLNLDPLQLTHLSFRVKREAKPIGPGPIVGYTSCYIKIRHGNDLPSSVETPPLNLSSYSRETDEWQLVNIPLSHFTGLDTSKLIAVALTFDYNLTVKLGNLQIDDIQFSKGYGKPVSTGEIRIDRENKQLLINLQPFNIKAVGYQPTSIGCVPPNLIDPDLLIIDPTLLDKMYDRDLTLLQDMGCNTIRTWGEPGIELMDKASQYGIKVIAGFWMDTKWTTNYADPFYRQIVKQNFRTFVNTYKGHPALLMWSLGNENNYVNNPIKPFYSLCNELAQIAYEEEISGAIPGSYHPVMIVNGDLYDMGVHEKGAEDLQLNCIDIWGANAYHGDFNSVTWTGKYNDWTAAEAHPDDIGIDWFELFKEKSFKPLVITEYGSDAFRTTGVSPVTGYEDEDMQADWVRSNTLEIMSRSDVCLGGSLMAYSDEWWKYSIWESWEPEWEEHLSIHDEEPGYPWLGDVRLADNYPNEEWWGIVKIALDGTWEAQDLLDDVRPRKVYNTLKLIFEGAKVVEQGESLQAAINGSSSGDTIYVTDGLFEEDVSIKDKDDIKIVGDGSEDTTLVTNLLLENSDSSIESLSILYKTGDAVGSALGTGYAGITSINSAITVRNCIIMPDPYEVNDAKYGKGIQIWNMYGSGIIEPLIENNLILNADAGVYLYSQAQGEAILGEIKNNTLDLNNYGIVMRTHKENPEIHHNIITRSQDAIHLTYNSLLSERLNKITDNSFGGDSFDNVRDIWCEESNWELEIELICLPPGGPGGPGGCSYWNGNIDGDPQYEQEFEYPGFIYPVDLDYTPWNPDCGDKGFRLE